MSVPITDDTTPEPEFLAQYSAGTWKSPVKIPLSLEVSTKVNPEFAKPSSTEPPQDTPLLLAMSESSHSSSSNVISNNLPKLSPVLLCP